jgi:tetratricopeptide (TPR) repeat protein
MVDRQVAFRQRIITKLLNLEEKASCPDVVVAEILAWTNAEPFLTQKLCGLIDHSETFIPAGEEAARVEQLVRSHLIEHWETQGASAHLQRIQQGLLNHPQCDPLSLLRLYRKLLQTGEITADGSPAQAALLNLGLVEQHQATLKVANRIYQSVFDTDWIDRTIANGLQPAPATTPTPQTSVAIAPSIEAAPPFQPWKAEDLAANGSFNDSLNGSQAPAEQLQFSLNEQPDPPKIVNSVPRSNVERSNVERNELENVNDSTSHRAVNQATPATGAVAVLPASEVEATHSSARKLGIGRYLWILLGIASLTLIGYSLFRWLQVETRFKQANERLNQKEYQQAIEDYNTLLKLDSNYYQAWTNRGYALAGLKDYSKMLESCSTATIIEPKSLYAWNCKGEALHNLKQYQEAIAAFDQAMTLDSNDPIFWINKTESLLALRQTDAAMTTINRAIERLEQMQTTAGKEGVAREFSIALSHQGKALSQKQDHDAALKAYERSLTYDPNYFVALRGRGIALQELKRYEDAIAQFQQILDRPDPNQEQKAEAAYYLGLTFCQSQQRERAIAALDQALTLKPNYQAAEQAKKSCLK